MDYKQLHKEFKFKATTSSGPGGQHVNKVATRILLELDVVNSDAFAKAEYSRILENLSNRLTKDGILQVSSQDSRSQSKNKELAIKKAIQLLERAARPKKVRKKRMVPKAAKRKRLQEKKRQSEKKENRNYRY